jgi:tetratricopeptide (TPR) repeat protein
VANKLFRVRLCKTPSPLLATTLVVLLGCGAAFGENAGESLPISADQSQALIEKAVAMEAQIQQRRRQQQRQQQRQEQRQEQQSTQRQEDAARRSREYQTGFSDGYNKAILDLVKSRLLNDPSLSPKLIKSSLRQTTCVKPATAHSLSVRPVLLQPHPSMANTAVQAEQASRSEKLPNDSAPQFSNSAIEPTNRSPIVTTAVTTAKATPDVADNRDQDAGKTTVDSTGTALKTATVTTITTATSAVAPVEGTHIVVTETMQNAAAATGSDSAKTTPAKPLVSNPSTQPSTETGADTDTATQDAVQSWIQKGNAYLKARQWQQAISAATGAIALDASLVDSYILRSWAYAENGQTQKAMEDIHSAIGMAPDNGLAYNNLGYVNELLNNRGKAQESYQKACDLNYQPACATARKLKQIVAQEQKARIDRLTNLSYQQFQQKDWKGVVKTATELLRLDPQNTVALVNRAGAYTEMGLYNRAMDDCNNALIIDPDMGLA